MRDKIQRLIGKKETLETQHEKLIKAKSQLENVTQAIENVQVFIQNIAQETQNTIRMRIQNIVQSAIDTCFPYEYHFQMNFETRRGKTECDLYLETDAGERVNIQDAAGGGVADIVSFGLRIAAWTISRTDNIILLDEPFKFLSRDLRPLGAEIIKRISDKLNIQFIIITHDSEILDIADKEFKIKSGKIT